MNTRTLQKMCKYMKLSKICEITGLDYNRISRKVRLGLPLTTDEAEAIEKAIKEITQEKQENGT